MKPPQRTNSLPIVQNQLSEQALTCNQPMVSLLIDNTIRYLVTVNQYSGSMISDTKHILISGSPLCQNTGLQFQGNEQYQNIINALISSVTDRLISSDYLSRRN